MSDASRVVLSLIGRAAPAKDPSTTSPRQAMQWRPLHSLSWHLLRRDGREQKLKQDMNGSDDGPSAKTLSSTYYYLGLGSDLLEVN